MSLEIESIGGFCPVQADGKLDGKPFYFRARGSTWTFDLVEEGDPVCVSPDDAVLHVSGSHGDTAYAAGWMEISEAEAIIRKIALAYEAGLRGVHCR